MEQDIKKYLYKNCSCMWMLYVPIEDHIALDNIYDFYFNDVKPTNGTSLELLYYGMYYFVNKDYKNMIMCYMKAINMKYAPAMFNLGFYYEHITKNYTKMKKYYRKGVNYNSKRAMHSLAKYYCKKKKISEMKRYLYKAIFGKRPTKVDGKISKSDVDHTSRGLSTSMVHLGKHYYRKKKFDKMKFYYDMAIQNGNTTAIYNYINYHKKKYDTHTMMKYCIMYLKKYDPYSIGTHCTKKKYNKTVNNINEYFDINRNIPLLIECHAWLNNKHLPVLINMIATYVSNKVQFAKYKTEPYVLLKRTYDLYEKCDNNIMDPTIKDVGTLIEKINILPIGNLKELITIIIKHNTIEDYILQSNTGNNILQKINDANNKNIYEIKKRDIKKYIEAHKFRYIDIEIESINKIYDTYFNKMVYPYGTITELLYYGMYCQIKKKYALSEIYYKIAVNEGSVEASTHLANYYNKIQDTDNAITYYLVGARKKDYTSIIKLNKLLNKTDNMLHLIRCKDYLSKSNNRKLVKCVVQHYNMQDKLDNVLQSMNVTMDNIFGEAYEKHFNYKEPDIKSTKKKKKKVKKKVKNRLMYRRRKNRLAI